MKNTILSALLALGIGLTPGFGLNFMGGNSVDWGHTDTSQSPSKTVEMTDPETKSPVALSQPAPAVHKSKVASADTSPVPGAR